MRTEKSRPKSAPPRARRPYYGHFCPAKPSLTSLPCALLILQLSAILPLCSISEAPAPGAVAAASPAQSSALTPLAREIERQRARLASSDTEGRRDAVQRLGAMSHPQAARVAATGLRDRAAIVRATSARAVLSLPHTESVPLLIPLLRDRDELVRREAAYALGETRSRDATAALISTLDGDRSAGARGAAAVALGQIGDESAVAALMRALSRRVRASGFLNRLRRRTVEENEFVRRSAARSLGQIGSRTAVPALIAALANEQSGDDVRREAAHALGLIGDTAAIPALRAALTARDPYLSRTAYEALRKLDPAGTERPM